ncbi:hypothetical protein Leryth_011420 [Lithospermum erythrorhizon]|nr:hypothetical protein Leryth_011420 [Lithospermum erythrorhizon]
MTSTAAQFAPSRGMGIYEPLYQMNMWEDAVRGDISPPRGTSIAAQEDIRLQNKSESTSQDPLGLSDDVEDVRSLSEKVQRRLAQNREAARKSRLRKKAYIQQLETSRLKLAQLELELERVRQQRMYIGGASGSMGFGGSVNPVIAAFEMEYAQWVEELQRKNSQLRTVLQSPISDVELQMLVETVLRHYYDLFRMKAEAARADVFYLLSGMWRTPVERFFLWLGGFKPSEIIKIIMPQIQPLAEQQQIDVGNLKHSCQQAEDALSQGMDKLQQTLSHSITLGSIVVENYGSRLASAVEKLESMESFVNQGDHLRQQALHQICRILTTRQAARGLLAFGEYFQRLQALSSLWAARPRVTIFN